MRYVTTFILLLTFLTTSLSAEIVYLKNGDSVAGYISGQDLRSITIVTEKGRRLLQKSQIKRIYFASTEAEEEAVKNRDLIKGMEEWQPTLNLLLEKRRKTVSRKTEEKESRTREESEFFKDEILEVKERKRKIAAKKSALVPGWGQFYKGHNYRGWAIVGGVVLALGGTYYSAKAYSASKDKYNNQNMEYVSLYYWHHSLPLAYWSYSKSTEARNTMSDSIVGVGLLGSALLAFYFVGVGDAYYTDPKMDDENAVAYRDFLNDPLVRTSLAQPLQGRTPYLPGRGYGFDVLRLGYSFSF